jgi:hypothetical protein|nr:MAG TPA: hypothetical protein [Caudoviricetes sp.]
MKEALQQIANNNGWHFDYGRSDFHNLETEADKEYYFFLDPIEESVTFNEYIVPTKRTYNGRFMLLKHSDFDRVYNAQSDNNQSESKYEQYIKPCKEEVMKIANTLCGDYTIEGWRMIEVINLYDNNFDGVIVNYQVAISE